MIKLITTDSYFNLFNILVKELDGKCNRANGRNVIFCEEKVSLMAERMICASFGGSFNTDVYSFGNFMRVKKPLEKILTKEASAMAVKRILSDVKLSCFKSSRAMLAPTLSELIMQLKSAKVTPNDLLYAIEQSSGMLKNKLTDIYSVFVAYEEFINTHGYEDQSSSLSYLPEIISESKDIACADVYLVGFSGFTAQMRSAINTLIEKAGNVTAILCKGDNPLVYVNETAEYIKNYCKKLDLALLEINEDGGYNLESKIITQNLFTPRKNQSKIVTDKIYYGSAINAPAEMERVAEIIKASVLKGECRYRDFTVALPNVVEYKQYVKRAFDTLRIPYFLDERKRADNHPVVTLILAYIEIFRKNFERKAISTFFKNPLFEQDKNLSDSFENYIIKYNVNYGRIKEPLKYETDKEQTASLEQFRQKLCSVLNGFNVRGMLRALNVKEKVAEWTETLKSSGEIEESAVNAQVYDAIVKILDEMDVILSNVEMSITEYKNVFTSGVIALELSIIPQYNDAVFVGEYKETALAKAKRLFVVGLTSSVPTVQADVALLSDGDIDALEQIKVMIEPKIRIVNHRTRENLALALCAFLERLYLSYPIVGIDGAKNAKSQVLTELENTFTFKSFPNENGYLTFRQGVKTFAKECGQFVERENCDFMNASAFFNAVGEDKLKHLLDNANKEMQVVLEKTDRAIIKQTLSPTTIEDYYKCPYRAFLSHSVKLKEREEGVVQAFSVGNLMHDIFSEYCVKLDEVCDEQSSSQLFNKIKEEVLKKEEYKKFLSDSVTSSAISRVLKECEKYCFNTYCTLKNSSFSVETTEAQFGDGKFYPAVKLNDGKFKIKGKIDRVDVSDNYFRVLDYKTGTADAVDKSLFAGIKLQLYLYAAAVAEKFKDGQKKLAGLYYLPVQDKYDAPDKKDKALAVGKTLNDEQAVLAQDNLINDKKKSAWVEVDAKGKVKNSLSQSALSSYVDYAVKLSELAAQRMAEGVIVASPYNDTCQYCVYKALCGGGEENSRKLEKVNEDTIINAVEGGKENAEIDG